MDNMISRMAKFTDLVSLMMDELGLSDGSIVTVKGDKVTFKVLNPFGQSRHTKTFEHYIFHKRTLNQKVYLVTFKIPMNTPHDPANKITSICPMSEANCTDSTGEHHTVVILASSLENLNTILKTDYPDAHLTRIEGKFDLLWMNHNDQ